MCDQARFIKDVTIADGTTILPAAKFTKIWRIKNIGACTWNTNYSLRFVGGDWMGVSKTYPIQKQVRPGENVDIAVDLFAPESLGT